MNASDLMGLMSGGNFDPDVLKAQGMVNLLRGQRPQQPPQPVMQPPQPRQMGPVMGPPVPEQPQAQAQQTQQPRRALPRAMANYQAPPQVPPAMQPQPAQPPGDIWDQRIAALQPQRQQAEAEMAAAFEPPDRSEMERVFKQRVEQSHGDMLRGLAAIEAGKDFAPIAQSYIHRSDEAQAPMKMAGGTMTPQGFIEDPGYKSELSFKRAQARLASIDKAEQFNLTQQERARLQQERIDAQAEMQAARLENARMIAAVAASNRPRAEPGTWGQVGTDPKTGKPVFQNNKTLQLASHNDQGQPIPYGGTFTPKSGGEKLLTPKQIDDVIDAHSTVATTSRLAGEFKPQYAGWGGAADVAVGTLPGVNNAASEWWRNYRRESELIERHGLFGASLTAGESAAWRDADINPRMNPQEIQRRLARREEILRNKYGTRLAAYKGYDTSALPTLEPKASPAAPAAPQAGPPVGAVVDFNSLP